MLPLPCVPNHHLSFGLLDQPPQTQRAARDQSCPRASVGSLMKNILQPVVSSCNGRAAELNSFDDTGWGTRASWVAA